MSLTDSYPHFGGTVRAGIEHPVQDESFKILRDYRRAARTLADDASGIANLHNIILAGPDHDGEAGTLGRRIVRLAGVEVCRDGGGT
ncbi:hypothetical protein ACIBD9_24895 [Micromonospora sp. NPDC050784]|uniref:hypothetical protein n=1 Tax=Micromonospora sp. NPDC050784 TaxID=3364281 RepID=UPI0037A5FEF1